jgi:hypothetical protein
MTEIQRIEMLPDSCSPAPVPTEGGAGRFPFSLRRERDWRRGVLVIWNLVIGIWFVLQ